MNDVLSIARPGAFRRRRWSLLVGSLAAVLALILAVTLLAPAARAEEYPSWDDVQNAQANEQAKQREVARIKALLSGLSSKATAAKRRADARAAAYERAQARYTESAYRSQQLEVALTAARARQVRSTKRVGLLAARLARTGNGDVQAQLLFGGDQAELLNRLGRLSQLGVAAQALSTEARQARNSATVIAAQAREVKAGLADLAAAAERALQDAKEAAAAAQAAVEQQQANEATLTAQLEVLQQNRRATEADYQRGVEARRAAAAAAAARKAAAAEAARRAAAEEAARRAAAGSGGGVGGSSGGSSGGSWRLPVGGWISDRFGPRPNAPVAGVSAFHRGTDIAAACGTPVRAASSGTVVYAGWLGTYGYFVLIDHGNGVQTGYAHNSRILVSDGQRVSAGDTVTLVGTTGASSGCHLHFEVRQGGAGIDAQPFMRARGVTLG